MESNVTATVEIRLSVNAERWAAINGLAGSNDTAASLAKALKEALARFEELIPELQEAKGTITLTPSKWVASGSSS